MRFQTLQDWLAWQEILHPKAIDLKLNRVIRVLRRLNWKDPPWTVVTVAGTNGKGSCVAMLEAILQADHYRVGAFTSPHLVQYNERIRLLGREVDDTALCRAFDRVDRARRDITLTYFEFSTLAALNLFRDAALDIVILEVGLGGRLDAVNAVDADVALITTVDIDHVAWLGGDRERIGREKAGILRTHRPAVCGDPDPPDSLLDYAQSLETPLKRLGADFGYRAEEGLWNWWSKTKRRTTLPMPSLRGAFQLQNAAAVLMVLECLVERHPVTQDAVRLGLQTVSLPGRFQVITGNHLTLVLDVAHNPQAARALAQNLAEHGHRMPVKGRTHGVLAMLNDKDVEGVAVAIDAQVDVWYTAGLEAPRGLSGEILGKRIQRSLPTASVRVYDSVVEALRGARSEARQGDRIVVFGSFYTVDAAQRVDLERMTKQE